MALRVKEVEVGGRKFRIANAQMGPWRRYTETLDAVKKGELSPDLGAANDAFLLNALQRADPQASMDMLRDLDGDDYQALTLEVLRWFNPQPEGSQQGEAASV